MHESKCQDLYMDLFTIFVYTFPSFSCFIFPSLTSNEALARCKQRIELIANTLELEGFSRIDAFVNVNSGEVLIS